MKTWVKVDIHPSKCKRYCIKRCKFLFKSSLFGDEFRCELFKTRFDAMLKTVHPVNSNVKPLRHQLCLTSTKGGRNAAQIHR